MSELARIAFEPTLVMLRIASILPLRSVPDNVKRSSKYKLIANSIAEVGIIEPPVVAKAKDQAGKYLLLDGHLRINVIAELNIKEVQCLIANDDEAFTYNKRINRLATVQEHYMLRRAIERGVSEEKLAAILNVNISMIKRRKSLLIGICPEVIDLFKDKVVNPDTFEVIRKMKPMRQIEVAELMCLACNFTATYAKALLAATRQADLVRSDQPKKVQGLTQEQMDRMEREMSGLQQEFKAVEASYGDDVLHLVIASGYLKRLVANRAINRYLTQHHPEILDGFQAIVSAVSIDQADPLAAA